MNYGNMAILLLSVLTWTTLLRHTVPTQEGRAILGLLGSCVIGIAYALAGVTIFKGVV